MKKKGYFKIALLSVLILPISINIVSGESTNSFNYEYYKQTLSQTVNEQGLVDYQLLKNEPKEFNYFIAQLQNFSEKEFNNWNDQEKIAFWINAYNAITLKVIVDHYPIKASGLSALTYPKNSIRQISGVWTKKQFNVMGTGITLDTIEHHILREKFKEPRIHMALVCAAISCPYLRVEPYEGNKLESQLEDQTKRFLARSNSFEMDFEKKEVRLSSIFKWFGKDFLERYAVINKYGKFDQSERAVLNFIYPMLEQSEKKLLDSEDFKLSYLFYDWTLNEQKGDQ